MGEVRVREILEQRVRDLRAELQTGQKMVAELEGQLIHLRSTVLRISGAVQVLEELLSGEEHEEANLKTEVASTVTCP